MEYGHIKKPGPKQYSMCHSPPPPHSGFIFTSSSTADHNPPPHSGFISTSSSIADHDPHPPPSQH